jgi:hypothetical protein
MRRAYRATFAAAVCLAAIGAPTFMQGFVLFVEYLLTKSAGASDLLRGLAALGVGAVPMVLAGLAWRQTQAFAQALEDELSA